MTDPIAPAWFVFPLAGIAMIFTAGYLIALREAPRGVISPPRHRLRTASAWVSMFTLPLTAYGFGIATTDDPKTFMMVWVSATALLGMIFLLSLIDLTLLATERRREIALQRQELRNARGDLVTGASRNPVSESLLSDPKAPKGIRLQEDLDER